MQLNKDFLVVFYRGSPIRVLVKDIILFMAQDKYIDIYIKGKETPYLFNGTIKRFERELGTDFFKVRRSQLVRRSAILSVSKGASPLVKVKELSGSVQVKASRRLAAETRKALREAS